MYLGHRLRRTIHQASMLSYLNVSSVDSRDHPDRLDQRIECVPFRMTGRGPANES